MRTLLLGRLVHHGATFGSVATVEYSPTMPSLVGPIRDAIGAVGVGTAVEGYGAANQVALTYDDGPDPRATQEILEVLREHGATATFFMLMTRVRLYPAVVHEVLAAGHEVALHGVDHRNLAQMSPLQVRARLKDGLSELSDVAQTSVTWFRPPYISLSLAGWLASRGVPHTFVAAGSSLRDWEPLTDAQRIDAFSQEVSPGDVILAHDSWPTRGDGAFDGPAPDVDRPSLTREALRVLEERELNAVSLGQIATQGGRRRTRMRVSVRRHG